MLILGLSAVIKLVKFKRETRIIEIPLTLATTIIFFILCNINQDINRVEAIVLMLLFLCFIIYTIYMSKKGEQFDSNDELIDNYPLEHYKTTFHILF